MEILDCTLRDGGYYTNWDFDTDLVNTYIQSLNSLPIDIIELGYRSNPLLGYYGKFFYCPVYILEQMRMLSNKKIAIMVNEKDVTSSDANKLLEPILNLIDMVRIAIDPKNFNRSLKLAETIKKMGFQIGFNVMYMSKWVDQKDFFNQLSQIDGIADYLYMVDSYGSVYPEDVIKIYNLARAKTNVKLGFHGHNNLELAFINTLTAIQCGVEIVDTTITGMGRGSGNLKTELLLSALNSKGVLDVDFNPLSEIVDGFSKLQEEYGWNTNLPYMVSGANSLPQKEVMEWVGKRYYSFNSIIRAMSNRSKGILDNLEFKIFRPEDKVEKAIIVGGGPNGTIHANATKEFLSKNLDIVVIHSSSKNVQAFKNISNKQIHCLSGNEGYRLETTFKDINMDNRFAILPPYPRIMGTYIPDFFNNYTYELLDISFTSEFKDSVTATAIQTAIELGVKELFFIGYDGYFGSVSSNQLELFNENETLFMKLKELGFVFCSLTPTRYSELPSKSIYELQ